MISTRSSRALGFVVGLALVVFGNISVDAQDMTSTLVIGGSRIDVNIESADLAPSRQAILKWVQNAAEAIATYYGKYPVPHATLRINSFEGHGVRHGMTWGIGGGLIKISVGNETKPAEFAEDWMLTHEMVHLSFPSMADNHHWMEEGLATYVEPIARIQAGQMPASDMWTDLARDMRKGILRPDDKGLDNTHTWASTYWGGALFSFLADIEIRKQTNNRKGLQDALRAILNSHGDITQDWPIENAFKVGDRATGTSVLTDMYAKWKDQPVTVDLPALWKELGIESDGHTVHLNDDAPLAAIRRSITSPDTAKAAHSSGALPSAVFAGNAVATSRRCSQGEI